VCVCMHMCVCVRVCERDSNLAFIYARVYTYTRDTYKRDSARRSV